MMLRAVIVIGLLGIGFMVFQNKRVESMNNQAVGLMNEGKHQEAIAILEEAHKISLDNVPVMLNLAKCHVELKKYETAESLVKQALSLKPDDKAAAELLEKIKSAASAKPAPPAPGKTASAPLPPKESPKKP